MAIAFETLKIPKPIYKRLKELAKRKNLDLIELLEQFVRDQQDQDQLHASMPEEDPVAPIYQIHQHAVDLGVRDLAENVDKYLYGLDGADE